MSTIESSLYARVAIITGAAQGIGRAIALRLAKDGLYIAVVDLPDKLALLDAVVADIQQLNRKAIALTYDITKEKDMEAMVAKTVDELGRLDVVSVSSTVSRGSSIKYELNIFIDGGERWDQWRLSFHYERSTRSILLDVYLTQSEHS